MFSVLTLVTLALTTSAVMGYPSPPRPSAFEGTTELLEEHDAYLLRYRALGCENKLYTVLYTKCCHRLPAADALSDHRDLDCFSSGGFGVGDALTAVDIRQTVGIEDNPSDFAALPILEKASNPEVDSTKVDDNAESIETDFTTQQAATVYKDGYATYYYQGGNAGACGKVHGDNELVAAIDTRRYGWTGQRSELCDKKVRITNPKNGKSVTVRIEDACPTCKNKNSIDLSVKAFKSIATLEQGLVKIHWQFL